jgi:hypothetical protein
LSNFKLDKKIGLTTIPKNKEKEWNDRLLKLKEIINENIEILERHEEPIKILKLFYDNF